MQCNSNVMQSLLQCDHDYPVNGKYNDKDSSFIAIPWCNQICNQTRWWKHNYILVCITRLIIFNQTLHKIFHLKQNIVTLNNHDQIQSHAILATQLDFTLENQYPSTNWDCPD